MSNKISSPFFENNLPVIVYRRKNDEHYTIEYMSEECFSLTGYCFSDLSGFGTLSFDGLINPDDRSAMYHTISQIIMRNRSYQLEYRIKTASGQEKWLLDQGIGIYGSQNELCHIEGIIIDITEKKEAEAIIRKSRERYRSIVDDVAVFICRFLSDGTLTFVNDAYCDFFKLRRDDLVGSNILDLVLDNEKERIWSAIRSINKDNPVIHDELKIIAASGEKRYLKWIVRILSGGSTQNTEYQSVGVDITEKKESEFKLEYRLKIEKLISKISRAFVVSDESCIDDEVLNALKQFSEFAWVDRSFIFLIDDDKKTVSNAYEWCSETIQSKKNDLQNIPIENFFWLMKKLETFEIVQTPRVSDLTPEEKSNIHFLTMNGVQSICVVPMVSGHNLIGFMGFNSIHKEKICFEEDKNLLKMIGNITASAIDSAKAKRLIMENEIKYRNLFETALVALYRSRIDDGKMLAANHATAHIFGFDSLDEFMNGFSATQCYLHPENRLELLQLLSEQKRVDGFEFIALKKDGIPIYLSLSAALYPDEGFIEGAIIDISQRKVAEEKLRESEKKLKEAQRIAHLGNWIYDVKSNKVEWSNEVYQIFGYNSQQIDPSFDLFLQAVHPDDRELVSKTVHDCLVNNSSFLIEHRIVTPSGDIRFVQKRGEIIFNEKSEPMRVIGIVQDITEQKERERALKLKDSALASSINAIAFCDLGGKLTYVNKSFLKLWLYDDFKDVYGKHIQKFIRKENADEQLFEVLKTRHGYLDELTAILNDGSTRDVQISSTCVTDEFNKVVCIMMSYIDITKLKKTQKELRKYSQQLEMMVEERTTELNRALIDTEMARDQIDGILKSIREGLIVTDLHNRIILMNRASEDLLDVRFSEVIDRPIDCAIADPKVCDGLKGILMEKKDGLFDFEIAISGEPMLHYMQAIISVIRDKNGQKAGAVTIFRDITHEQRIDKMKTDFISTAAHELRTPLTSIQGFSEILLTRDSIPREDQKKYLGYINNQSMKLGNIISDLLDISRIESDHGFEFNPEITDINDIIIQVASYYQDISNKHTFKIDIHEDVVQALIDPEKIEQVFKNILSNAVKYSPDGGLIRIIGKVSDTFYRVSIQDQGIGMTPSQVGRIFEKFFRAETMRSQVEGTGLGMSIVRYIVEKHGGKVFVESSLGKGTSVTFTIPLSMSPHM